MRERSRNFRVVQEVPEQQPEGRLIADALRAKNMSARAAAAAAGISDTRWRHIVSGYQPAGQGNYIPVYGPADTVARMAQVVGVTPDELAQVGRSDAAGELVKLRTKVSTEPSGGMGNHALDLTDLTPDDIAAVRAVIEALRSKRD